MKKIACIVNPVSGLKKSLKVYYEVENEINQRNFKPILFLSKYAGHVEKIIESLPNDIDRILIFGGDGSINDVLNKLFEIDKLEKYKIGIMPTGSGNSVMHDLGLLKIKDALDAALGKNYKKADLNNVKFDSFNRLSVSVLGWGMFSYGNIRAEKLRWLGPIRYDVASIITLIEKKMHTARITIDNVEKKRTCAFIVGCNSIHTGKGMKVAPKGGFFDGKMDLVLVNENISRLQIAKVFKKVYDGSHIELPYVSSIQVKTFCIDPGYKTFYNIDGDIVESQVASVDILPKAFKLLI